MEDLGSIPGLGRSPGAGTGNPLQYSCLENPMDGESRGRGSLAGYSPHSHKEPDRTERLHFHFHFDDIIYNRKLVNLLLFFRMYLSVTLCC